MQICVCAVRNFELMAGTSPVGVVAARVGRVGTGGDGYLLLASVLHDAGLLDINFSPEICGFRRVSVYLHHAKLYTFTKTKAHQREVRNPGTKRC